MSARVRFTHLYKECLVLISNRHGISHHPRREKVLLQSASYLANSILLNGSILMKVLIIFVPFFISLDIECDPW